MTENLTNTQWLSRPISAGHVSGIPEFSRLHTSRRSDKFRNTSDVPFLRAVVGPAESYCSKMIGHSLRRRRLDGS